MSGRPEQLGRQLRRLRTIAGDPRAHPAALTLSRATHLAIDIAKEQTDLETAEAFAELVTRGVLDAALAQRLAAWATSDGAEVYKALEDDAAFGSVAMPIARDLDRFLRSVEIGASAPELPFEALTKHARDPYPPGSSKPSSRIAFTIYGRSFELAERGGQATVSVDDQPVELVARVAEAELVVPWIPILAAPMQKPEVHHEPSGIRVAWEGLILTFDLTLARARVEVG